MITRRLYYDDAFATEFTARVKSCEPALVPFSPVAKAPAWEVVLDQTAFYPTSGGQPHDLGKLGEANVIDVRDAEDEIIHTVDQPVELGEAKGCINWPRRFDHMQQHTGQHLLSAMFQERFGLPTISFHLGSELCTIDLRGPEPTEEILEGAERAANQIIFENRPVNVRYGTADLLSQLGVRKEVERDGILRAIEIESADLQPCGGTHVQRTGQIGMLLVRRCTKVRQDWRVEFVCGRRAERFARRDFQLLRRLAEELRCAPEDVVAASQRALTEREAHFKNVRALLQRLAEAEAVAALQSTNASASGIRVVACVFGEETQEEYPAQLATQLAKFEKTVALLARSASGHVIFAQHPGTGKDLNALLKQTLQRFPGKGGGTPDFVRARLNENEHAEEAIAFAKGVISGA
ncbi:MAG TPA: alanyl-tRNA editing protein [Candidatus Acidoferrum sp.]